MMKVCIVNFSGREYGNCKRVADFIHGKLSADKIVRFDFNAIDLTPCGKCKYECFGKRENCPYFSDEVYSIYDNITNADTAFFIVPNYCDYPCANYFILNERSQCYFQGREDLLDKYLKVKKKFIVISNTGKTNFLTAFGYQCEEPSKSRVLFLSAMQYGKISIDGNITESVEALQDIEKFIIN